MQAWRIPKAVPTLLNPVLFGRGATKSVPFAVANGWIHAERSTRPLPRDGADAEYTNYGTALNETAQGTCQESLWVLRFAEINHCGGLTESSRRNADIKKANYKPDAANDFGQCVQVPPDQSAKDKADKR